MLFLRNLTRLVYVIGTCSILVSAATAAWSQELPPDCMRSLPVKKDQPIAYFGWLPQSPGAGATLSCLDAETLRQELFRGSGLTSAELAAAVASPNPVKAQRDLLAKRLVELRTVNTLDAAKTLGKLLVIEVGKYHAAYLCLAAEAPPALLVCGGFLLALAKQGNAMWNLAQEGGIGPARAAAVAEVEREIAALDKIIATSPPKRRSLDDAKKLLLNAQIGLCQEIKKSCL
ncbi:MAG: hypothetical protein IPK81_06090 [Rhodospirillales bacterium]|nr:MAG: hypothetical protein IPK81_06090 [Rhodospirillales bacterium]